MLEWVAVSFSINSGSVSIPVSELIPPHLPPWNLYVLFVLCLCLYFFFVDKIAYSIL